MSLPKLGLWQVVPSETQAHAGGELGTVAQRTGDVWMEHTHKPKWHSDPMAKFVSQTSPHPPQLSGSVDVPAHIWLPASAEPHRVSPSPHWQAPLKQLGAMAG